MDTMGLRRLLRGCHQVHHGDEVMRVHDLRGMSTCMDAWVSLCDASCGG